MRLRVSYANITSTLALVVAMSGVSYAAITIPKNSVGSTQVKPDSLVGADINESKLAKVPNANRLAGKTLAQVQFPAVVASGTTLVGQWGIDSEAGASISGDWRATVSYPVPFAATLDFHILQAGDSPTTECPGGALAPAALPGHVCVYTAFLSGGISLFMPDNALQSPRGFQVSVSADGNDASSDVYAYGSWAATAS